MGRRGGEAGLGELGKNKGGDHLRPGIAASIPRFAWTSVTCVSHPFHPSLSFLRYPIPSLLLPSSDERNKSNFPFFSYFDEERV